MANKQATIKDPDLAKVGAALKRAAANARKLEFETNTPVYVYRDGKIIDIVAEHRKAQSARKTNTKASFSPKPRLSRKTTSAKTKKNNRI